MFLCLFAGGQPQQLPKGLGTEDSQTNKSHITFSDKRLVKLNVGYFLNLLSPGILFFELFIND